MSGSFSDQVFAVPSKMDIVGAGLLALTKAVDDTQRPHLPANCRGTIVYFYYESPLTTSDIEGTEIHDIAKTLSEDGAHMVSDMSLYSPYPYALFLMGDTAAERREKLLEDYHQGRLHTFLDSDSGAPQAAVVFSVSKNGNSMITYAVSLHRSYEVFINIGEGNGGFLMPTDVMDQYTPLAVKQMREILRGVSGEDDRFSDIVEWERANDVEMSESSFIRPSDQITSGPLRNFVMEDDSRCIDLESMIEEWSPGDLA